MFPEQSLRDLVGAVHVGVFLLFRSVADLCGGFQALRDANARPPWPASLAFSRLLTSRGLQKHVKKPMLPLT